MLIVERLGQFAAALREQQAGTIQRIGRLVERSNLLMQPHLTRNHCGASRTLRRVSIHGCTRRWIQFVAGVEDGELLDDLPDYAQLPAAGLPEAEIPPRGRRQRALNRRRAA